VTHTVRLCPVAAAAAALTDVPRVRVTRQLKAVLWAALRAYRGRTLYGKPIRDLRSFYDAVASHRRGARHVAIDHGISRWELQDAMVRCVAVGSHARRRCVRLLGSAAPPTRPSRSIAACRVIRCGWTWA
jgi:hypothetical protein